MYIARPQSTLSHFLNRLQLSMLGISTCEFVCAVELLRRISHGAASFVDCAKPPHTTKVWLCTHPIHRSVRESGYKWQSKWPTIRVTEKNPQHVTHDGEVSDADDSSS